MINYIKELLGDLKNMNYPGAFLLIGEIVKELDRLDPRDFLPSVQSKLVRSKAFLKAYVGVDPTSIGGAWPKEQIGKLCDELLVCLDSFTGEGSCGKRRTFSFIRDKDLLVVIERDYFELKTILFPAGAWKSAIIISGSILEAVRLHAGPGPRRRAVRAGRHRRTRGHRQGRGSGKLRDRRSIPDPAAYRRLYAALLRRGFPADLIRAALRPYWGHRSDPDE